jgi:aspartate-semialdehyde dehydrogenase
MRTGFVGWRGMVGSVLLDRMRQEDDFAGLDPVFFSTSSSGLGPDVGGGRAPLLAANDLAALAGCEVVLSCQGGDYTTEVYDALRSRGWRGLWIDAASTLRMRDEAVLVLDPVNGAAVREAMHGGARTFVGANCTVSLLLMGLEGLLRTGHVEWISTMSYQAASGAGAGHMRELVAQMRLIGERAGALTDPAAAILDLDRNVAATLADPSFPTSQFGAPLAASALPWIDRLVEHGQTREEWKSMVEANKILGRTDDPLVIDGLCVRIGAMRCHAQAVTIKLDAELPLDEVEALVHEAHPWSSLVPNTREHTLAQLTPAAVAGSLVVPVGRLRRMKQGPTYLTAFTVGDQLLWGAAEPLRRTLRMWREVVGR